MDNYNGFTETHCELCGERFRNHDEVAEMYHPDLDEESSICHAECGLQRDYIVA
jgi:tRNA U54 and U55 pseudouridine synthase Pus10